jgi:hypothetical protein
MSVRQIYETAQAEGTVKRRLRELIEYMKWKQGWQTIECYEHYFDATRHAEIQDAIYQKMDEALKQDLKVQDQPRQQAAFECIASAIPPQSINHLIPNDPDFDFLRSIGGGRSDNE